MRPVSRAGRLVLTGQALPKRAPGENNVGVRFRAEMKATAPAEMETAGDHLDVAARTVYVDDRCCDRYREKDLAAACTRDLRTPPRAYDALRKEHVADHQRFFRRMRLELPVDAAARPCPPTSGSRV